MLPREAAELFISRGWYPIPLSPGTKNCKDKDWLRRVYVPEDFGEDDNIGIRLVKAGEKDREVKLVAVDLDCEEAVKVAKLFLPETAAAWGRASKPLSQLLYVSPFDRTLVLKGQDEKTILEIRTGHQSMAPPSTHPNGEKLAWVGDTPGEAPAIDPQELAKRARLVATTVLVARAYPAPGSRHEWVLALSGMLRSLEITEDEAHQVVEAAAELAGDDKLQDRKVEVSTTFAKPADSRVAAAGKLAGELGAQGLVDAIRKVWDTAAGFVIDDKGRTTARQENIRRALLRMGIGLRHDDFGHKMQWAPDGQAWRTLEDADLDKLYLEVERRFALSPSFDYFAKVVIDQARSNRWHPVTEWLGSLKWDGKPRLDNWLHKYMGAAASPYTSAVGRLPLLAAVRRVRAPGCKFDELLILESKQGAGKSMALRALCPKDEWFSDDLPLGVDSKQVIEHTAGKWIVEAQELTNMRKAQVEQLKASLSRQVDGPVRLAYGRISVERPRQFVIIGTTNSSAYLKDLTGNRRFWPIQAPRPLPEVIEDVREQLWAEAAEREAQGESIRLSRDLWPTAAIQQERREITDPWEEALSRAISNTNKVELEDAWNIVGVRVADRTLAQHERIVGVMNKLGFKKMAVRAEGTVKKAWKRTIEIDITNLEGSDTEDGEI